MRMDIREFFEEDEIYVKYDKEKGVKFSEFKKKHSLNAVEKITAFHIGRFGKYLYLPLIFEVDEEWFYVSELLRTDGHISKELNHIKLTSVTNELKEKIRQFFRRCGIGYIREKEYDRIVAYNKTLACILVKIFEIPAGNKTFICTMPKWMKHANLKLLACALRGAFDGDGCVQLTKSKRKTGGDTKRIRLYGASTRYLHDIKECLMRFNINSKIFKDARKNKTYFLQISRRDDIRKFAKKINFNHPKRRRKLSWVIKSYGNYYFLWEFEKIVIKILKRDGPMTIKELSNRINRKDSTVSEQITKLEKGNRIKTKRIGIRRIVFI
ncbi:winged helix-turn-helix transcriptional regulator [Candidatus Micrarchaeota archaeon]|nr:winged helix-turn-helix transcriptional regulator [Candidatus Micrarchaeota archaeon]